jgi:hypothetical protein
MTTAVVELSGLYIYVLQLLHVTEVMSKHEYAVSYTT